MRTSAFFIALLLVTPRSAPAQEWIEYTSTQDGFRVLFPGQPTIAETTWKSQMDYTLPARVYTATRGAERYTMTVVDYRGIEQLGIARAKACPPGNQQCRETSGIMGPGYWKHDARAAVMRATFELIARAAKVTNLAWEWQDMVEGNLIQLTNPDRSRTFAYVTMHENKLFIMEGTVPEGHPEPALFQQSLGWVDDNGAPVRYQDIIYSNAYHGMGVYPKPRAGRGGGAGAGGAGAANQPR